MKKISLILFSLFSANAAEAEETPQTLYENSLSWPRISVISDQAQMIKNLNQFADATPGCKVNVASDLIYKLVCGSSMDRANPKFLMARFSNGQLKNLKVKYSGQDNQPDFAFDEALVYAHLLDYHINTTSRNYPSFSAINFEDKQSFAGSDGFVQLEYSGIDGATLTIISSTSKSTKRASYEYTLHH